MYRLHSGTTGLHETAEAKKLLSVCCAYAGCNVRTFNTCGVCTNSILSQGIEPAWIVGSSFLDAD